MCVGRYPYLFPLVERWRSCSARLLCISSLSLLKKKKTQTGCNHTRRHYSADHRHGWMIDGWMCRGRKGGSGKRAAVSRQTRVYPLEKKKPPFLFFPILFYPVFCQLAQCHSLFCLDAPVPLYDKGRAERRWWEVGVRGGGRCRLRQTGRTEPV